MYNRNYIPLGEGKKSEVGADAMKSEVPGLSLHPCPRQKARSLSLEEEAKEVLDLGP